MREVLPDLLRWWRDGASVGVGTVVATWRSAPRQPGASMLVGPEGGLSPAELSHAEAADFRPSSLGRTTLRTELAGVAALGALVAFAALRGIG